jgi:hypothetical protein
MDAHPSAHHDEDVFARRFATGEQDFARPQVAHRAILQQVIHELDVHAAKEPGLPKRLAISRGQWLR